MSKANFEAARQLIQEKQYEEARALLRTIDHPKAQEWIAKIDDLDIPEFPEDDEENDLQDALPVKSYTNAAVIVLVLYFVLWLPGFIANIMYLHEAHETELIVNQDLPGVRALEQMQTFFIILPVILIALYAVFALVIMPNYNAVYSNIIGSL